jgi:hypothetical protein
MARSAPCPAATLRGLLPNVSALAMISLRLAPDLICAGEIENPHLEQGVPREACTFRD